MTDISSYVYYRQTTRGHHRNLSIKNRYQLVSECMLGVAMIILSLGLSILFNSSIKKSVSYICSMISEAIITSYLSFSTGKLLLRLSTYILLLIFYLLFLEPFLTHQNLLQFLRPSLNTMLLDTRFPCFLVP